MLPVSTVAAGKFVVPRVSVRLPLLSAFVATTTVNGTFDRGRVPSPMSTLHVPENVAILAPPDEPAVGFPTTSMFWVKPRAETPIRVVWNCPSADPALEIVTPIPTFKALRGRPPQLAPLGKMPEAAAVT